MELEVITINHTKLIILLVDIQITSKVSVSVSQKTQIQALLVLELTRTSMIFHQQYIDVWLLILRVL